MNHLYLRRSEYSLELNPFLGHASSSSQLVSGSVRTAYGLNS